MNVPVPSVLIVDDEKDKLESLTKGVRSALDRAEVRKWLPSDGEDPLLAFTRLVGDDTILVVTDLDLSRAVKGLFGYSVVAWCQTRFIPVGDFSRGYREALSKEPDLFQLRVPREEAQAVAYIVRVFEGFRGIREGIERHAELLSKGQSPAQVLATLLGRRGMESQLAPYLSRPGLFNSSLLDTLTSGEHGNEDAKTAEKTKLLTYILGHVLVNAVLKYPGPILSEGPFCAYLATSEKNIVQIAEVFEDAMYTGPFDGGERLFWRDKVDEIVEELSMKHDVADSDFQSFGDYHRAVMMKTLGDSLANHECERCGGVKGGFWCPFKKRAVCERSDCSSTASSWVPSGAYACRVERVFFDEWAPILGL